MYNFGARLDFGNCWGSASGFVYVYLNGIEIASAPKYTPSVTVEFDFHIGSILKISEVGGVIIQFNSLDIIQCNSMWTLIIFLLCTYLCKVGPFEFLEVRDFKIVRQQDFFGEIPSRLLLGSYS